MSFFDGLETIKEIVSISFVPQEFILPREGMSLEEIQALRPGANTTEVLSNSTLSNPVNSTIVVEETSDNAVKIETEVIETGP